MKSNTSSTILRRRLITCVSIFLKVLSELITHQLNVLILACWPDNSLAT